MPAKKPSINDANSRRSSSILLDGALKDAASPWTVYPIVAMRRMTAEKKILINGLPVAFHSLLFTVLASGPLPTLSYL
jgi:hypothetical protein